MRKTTGLRAGLRACAVALALAVLGANAWAGEFYETGGVAIKGYDAVAFFAQHKAVKGSAQHTAAYKGSMFHFASEANRDAFAADPEKYAPQYHGYCAFGTAGGYKAAVDPVAFTVVDGKLYLNYNTEVRKEWGKDIPGMIAKGDRNWPEVSRQTKVME